MTTATDHPTLSLAELDAYDPRPAGAGAERRYCCPLPACQGKPVDRGHQSLCVNLESGLWLCNRCTARGKLTEQWEARPRGQRRRAVRHRPFRLPEAPHPGRAATAPQLVPMMEACVPIAGSPGEAYLRRRGIPVEVATAAGVLFSRDWFGGPAVVFPFRDHDGRLVAACGRYTDGRTDPKTRVAGDLRLGVFATPGAFGYRFLVIVEGPIDALALAAVGVPAVAIGTTREPHWLRVAAAFKEVLVGLDADPAGDEGAARLLAKLTPFASAVHRVRPRVGKDWADWLQADEASLRRAFSRVASSSSSSTAIADAGAPEEPAAHTSRQPVADDRCSEENPSAEPEDAPPAGDVSEVAVFLGEEQHPNCMQALAAVLADLAPELAARAAVAGQDTRSPGPAAPLPAVGTAAIKEDDVVSVTSSVGGPGTAWPQSRVSVEEGQYSNGISAFPATGAVDDHTNCMRAFPLTEFVAHELSPLRDSTAPADRGARAEPDGPLPPLPDRPRFIAGELAVPVDPQTGATLGPPARVRAVLLNRQDGTWWLLLDGADRTVSDAWLRPPSPIELATFA